MCAPELPWSFTTTGYAPLLKSVWGTEWNSLVAVVVKLVVARKGKEDPKSWAEREENLSRCVHPHLKNRCSQNTGSHYRKPQGAAGEPLLLTACVLAPFVSPELVLFPLLKMLAL